MQGIASIFLQLKCLESIQSSAWKKRRRFCVFDETRSDYFSLVKFLLPRCLSLPVLLLDSRGCFILVLCCLRFQVLDDHMLVFDPKEQNSPDYYHRKRRQGRDMLKKANRDIRFAFDQVYGDSSTNVEVYERTTKAALDALLDGFNCSGMLFA